MQKRLQVVFRSFAEETDVWEQVVTDGENGWQYDKKEDYLMRIQEWKGMGENARGRMQNKAAISAEKFSSGNFAERVEKIYEQQIRKYRYENAA